MELSRNNFDPKVTQITATSISISWNIIPLAEIYKIEQQCKIKEWKRVFWGSRTSAKICLLNENFCYKFRIIAIKLSEDENQFVILQISDIIKACTLPALPSTINLYHSIRKDEQVNVKILLRRRPSLINIPAPNNLTPLINAIIFNKNDIADILLSTSSFDIHCENNLKMQTPLHIAFFYGNVTVARILINKKVNINAQDIVGMTPAHYAVDSEQIEILKLAFQNKCNTEIQDKCGWTLLQRAIAMNRKLLVIEFLIENGCSLNVKDNNNLSCLELAKITADKKVHNLIENAVNKI